MTFKNPYWTITTKIELLQWWIIVHSILYYDYNTTLVKDHVYDKNGVQLAKFMKKYPEEAKLSKYAYAFKGYNGSTGFDISSKLSAEHKDKAHGIINFILKTERERLS